MYKKLLNLEIEDENVEFDEININKIKQIIKNVSNNKRPSNNVGLAMNVAYNNDNIGLNIE